MLSYSSYLKLILQSLVFRTIIYDFFINSFFDVFQ